MNRKLSHKLIPPKFFYEGKENLQWYLFASINLVPGGTVATPAESLVKKMLVVYSWSGQDIALELSACPV